MNKMKTYKPNKNTIYRNYIGLTDNLITCNSKIIMVNHFLNILYFNIGIFVKFI
jgi:hypothetical protein